MTLLLGALSIGLILSLLAVGVFISFRVFNFPDITTDGSVTTGAAIAAVLIVRGMSPLAATLLGAVGGAIAGAATGVLHARFKIHRLLAGILGPLLLQIIRQRQAGVCREEHLTLGLALPLHPGDLGLTDPSQALGLGGHDLIRV